MDVKAAANGHARPDIRVATVAPGAIETALAVVGVFAEGTMAGAAGAIDKAASGRLSARAKSGDLDAAVGSSLMLYDVPGLSAERVLLVNLGKAADFDEAAFRKVLGSVAKTLAASKASDALVLLADVDVPGRSLAWRLQQASRILADGLYRFAAPGKRAEKDADGKGVRSIILAIAGHKIDEDDVAVRRGLAIAEGIALAKDLGNLPGNICNPGYFAETAKAMGREFGLKVDVLERDDMEKLGMGSFLSVGRASASPCKMIAIHYRGGAADAKPVVLLGKGITFDTGGISLKPGANLDEMKFDMSGAGSVFGAMQAVARLSLPINVVGLIAAAENMPGGNASRPGDVVTSMSGQTIEILNTDAEGRLLLCDALTYAERFEPACVIDIATLTGACVIALGAHASGLYANDDQLAEELLASGQSTGDRAWKMPLWDDYQSQLRSNFADMSNLGGQPAGSVTAACFLWRFAKAYKWAHLDIAGTASVSGDAKGSTGRPVPLLTDFLIERAARAH